MKKALILILGVILLYSCSDEEGKWDDKIKLSAKQVEFSVQQNAVTITTQGSGWWIDNVKLDDKYYNPGINLDDPTSTPYAMSEETFVIERPDKNTLNITMMENQTGKGRLLTISLQAGNYFDQISIKQVGN